MTSSLAKSKQVIGAHF